MIDKISVSKSPGEAFEQLPAILADTIGKNAAATGIVEGLERVVAAAAGIRKAP